MRAKDDESPLKGGRHGRHPRQARRTPVGKHSVDWVWVIARISIGRIFLRAFLDKTFGWGFTTSANCAWISGGSPTTGVSQGHR
ncbi:hypothetical protein [Nonomuraea sp. NPDC005650]|uniref:hypothetical protein n=1 Tax=Nonomuraea sp. NPDC005650 TaxID=3157045 RepID=UPI0033A862BF